jgi:hypothetical protein
VQAYVELATTPCKFDFSKIALRNCIPIVLAGKLQVPALAHLLGLPTFSLMLQEFMHDQLHTEHPDRPEFNPATAPQYLGKVSTFNSAAASFYAPSDLSGTGGMQREHI